MGYEDRGAWDWEGVPAPEYDPVPLQGPRTVKTRYRYVGALPARELPPDDGSDQPS